MNIRALHKKLFIVIFPFLKKFKFRTLVTSQKFARIQSLPKKCVEKNGFCTRAVCCALIGGEAPLRPIRAPRESSVKKSIFQF